MTGLWVSNYRCYVGGVYIFLVKRTIKNEYELVLGVLLHHTLQGFMGKRTYTFQFVLQQKTCIYDYSHGL